ncbi:hypothetical protein GCM10007028_26860 [Algibacter mikhailovii]|uniref:Uncharacterized protein n=2 Tax=Algibacter mikhailovii TaxID=425498 RepID=A0A918VCT2_9FLAO|nr:hypothetical protein GCM10007028_26860 [Algibacter mikhailovii]
MIFGIFLFQGCESHDSFGKEVQVPVKPSNLSYADIIGYKQYGYMQTDVPTYNSNGHPLLFEIVSIKKDGVVLDDTYLNATSILNYSVIETEKEIGDTGETHTIFTNDLSEAGRIIIEDGNPFEDGDYYFTIRATVDVENYRESTVFEDVLHLQVGWANGVTYCPFQVNFVNGENTISGPATVLGGRTNTRFELGSDSDKLTIDPISGAISMNPSYTVTETEVINPIIKLVYESNESVPLNFTGNFTAVLSTTPVELDKEVNYFFYPTLKPVDSNNPAFGGDGYTVETSAFVDKPNWVKKHFYKEIVAAAKLNFDEVLETRTEAGVTEMSGSQFNYWGPLKNPFETWLIADPVNLATYSGCFETKMVFWVKQNIPQEILDNVFPGQAETPVNIEIKITDNYSGDVYNTDWTQINDVLTCKIEEADNAFVGTPYPLIGEVGPEGTANNMWVKCEMDLPVSEYGNMNNFTIAFRTITNYDSDLPENLRGELYISDLHFVATEK